MSKNSGHGTQKIESARVAWHFDKMEQFNEFLKVASSDEISQMKRAIARREFLEPRGALELDDLKLVCIDEHSGLHNNYEEIFAERKITWLWKEKPLVVAYIMYGGKHTHMTIVTLEYDGKCCKFSTGSYDHQKYEEFIIEVLLELSTGESLGTDYLMTILYELGVEDDVLENLKDLFNDFADEDEDKKNDSL